MHDSDSAQRSEKNGAGKRSFGAVSGKVVSIWTTIFVLTFVPALAATPEDCSDGEDDPLLACESKMLFAQGDLLDALDSLVDQVEASQVVNLKALTLASGVTGEETDIRGHLGRIRREFEMANQAHSETTESDLEEMIERAGKKKGKDCGFKEAQDVQENPEFYLPLGLSDPDEGLGDGECGQFEAWDEDKGRMVKVNERSLPNICERVCEDDEIPEDPYAKFAFGQEKKWKKDRLKERHINRKSESIDATIQLTEKIKNSGYQIAAASALADSYKRNNELVMAVLLDTGDPLPPGDPLTACLQRDKTAEIAAWIAKIVLEVANTVAQVAAKVAEGAFEIQDKACRQSVAGFNTSVGCIPALIVKLVLEGASDVIEALIAGCDLTIEHGNYFGLDNNFECVAEIRNAQIQLYHWVWAIKQQGEDLDGDIGKLDGAVETLKRYVLENREYIRNTREIVLTPHGRRDEVQLYEPSPPTSPP